MLRKLFPRLLFLVASITAVVTLGLADSAVAEPAKPAASRPDPALRGAGAEERKFMTAAALGGIAEVELGQLAARKATQADVQSIRGQAD